MNIWRQESQVFHEVGWRACFKINRYYTDDWGAYERNLETNEHEIGKQNTQKIERKNLTIEHGLNV
jgi:IS1 family transposase